MTANASQDADNAPIVCLIDDAECHSVRHHIEKHHPEWTVERYQETYPDAPLLSAKAKRIVAANRAKKAKASQQPENDNAFAFKEGFFHDIFGFGNAPAAKSAIGNPIKLTVLSGCPEEGAPYMQDVDDNYVFNIDLAKKVCLGLEVNMNVYLWGFHGTGKTTLLEQCATRTGRPFLRVQHTANTEESHVLGQFTVGSVEVEEEELANDGTVVKMKRQRTVTSFQPGPLAIAMKFGLVYCADEYDFAMPSVISVYQPVLEGKALVIKDAPPEWRVIKPHPQFRFVATGNTNGVGDETGLYQGTNIQNAASYSRFHITEEVKYMDAKQESAVLRAQTGIIKTEADQFVKIAGKIRESFGDGEMSMTISPRELINAAKLSIIFGGNMMLGLRLAFINRCSRVDQKVVEEMAQRIIGS